MMDNIKLSLELSRSVWNYLEKRFNIKPRLTSSNNVDCFFSKDELAKVKSLTLVNTKDGLTGISHLKNLENLTIQTTQRTAYTNSLDLNSISDNDIAEIETLSNLKHLEITNQKNITSIDISNFKSLSTLILKQNEQLSSVVGLAENRTINSLTMFDLNSLGHVKFLDQFIEKNSNLEELNLDILMYPCAIGYNSNSETINLKALDRIDNMPNESRWHETLLGKREIVINNYQMAEMHKIAVEIMDKYCANPTSKLETVAIVDKWLTKNVKYNHEALGTKLRTEKIENGLFVGPIGGANSSYNAFKYHSCVCAGYARAMQYMLRLRNIKTSYVTCIIGKDIYNLSDPENENPEISIKLPKKGYHAICRIGKDYYCDPCSNASKYQKKKDNSSKYFMMTKKEARKYYALSYNEQTVTDRPTIPKELIEDAKIFADSEIDRVDMNEPSIDF